MKSLLHLFSDAHIKDRIRTFEHYKPFIMFRECLFIAFGTAGYALVVNQIIIPHNLVGGGLTGLCTIIYYLTHIPVWVTTLSFNLILLAFAVRIIGWQFCIKSVYGFGMLSFWYAFIPISSEPLLSDPFMAVVVCGIFTGCMLGIIFLNNGSTGGTDIIAMIITKYRYVSIGNILMLCDFIIISSAYFLPNIHSIEKVLFGLCFTFMCSQGCDWVMGRIKQSVQFFIFSKKYMEVRDAILHQLHRGVTLIDAVGGYSEQPTKVLTILCRKSEAKKIFRTIRVIDPDAFIAENQVEGVFGQGFDPIKQG